MTTPKTFDVLVTRDTTESTVVRVTCGALENRRDVALRKARSDFGLAWTRDDNMGGDPYIADEDELLEAVDPSAPVDRAPLVLSLNLTEAQLTFDALDMLDPEDEPEQAAQETLKVALWNYCQPDLASRCDVCSAAGPNPCDACLPGCVAETVQPTEAEISDWQDEVANGDTRRGLVDWVEASREADDTCQYCGETAQDGSGTCITCSQSFSRSIDD